MSRNLSPAALRAMFAQDTDTDLITLLTIYPTGVDTYAPVYLADSYTGILTPTLEEEDSTEEVLYGVKSTLGDTTVKNFIFLPLEISLPNDLSGALPSCTISLNYVTQELIQVVRTKISKPSRVRMDLVLSTTPNTVEASFDNFYITGISYSAEKISLELSMIDYQREPFPQHTFSPKYFPGLF